jgi:hypothetical protein
LKYYSSFSKGAAAMAGDTFAARASFRHATELDPNCPDAWIGLSGVVPILAEKQEYLRRALSIDPASVEAQAGLRYVEQLQAVGLRIAPARAPEAPAAADAASPPAATEPAIEHCYNHPDRETGLHCVQCTQPICGKCARMAPVGQLCPKCRRGRRPQQYQVSASHLVIAGGTALVVSALAALVLQFVLNGFLGFYVVFFAGPMTAEIIVRIVDRLTRAKRGRLMQLVVAAAIVIGMLPIALLGPFLLMSLMAPEAVDLVNTMSEAGPALFMQVNGMMLVYMAIGAATAVARLT